MRVLRPSCVHTFAMGSLLTATLSTMACDSPVAFQESGIPVITKASTQMPGEDARAGGPDTEASNDPAKNAAPDDLTPDDKGEPDALNGAARLLKWSFDSSSLAEGNLNYSARDRETTQSLTMDDNRIKMDASFTQLDRPMITDIFTQGTDLKASSESFIQNSSAKGALDILLVVDNSGSMTEEQSNLSGRLSPLLSFVDASDWRIGVVTTDPKDGCLRGLISKSDSNATSAFQTAVQAGIKGSGNERGILQAVAGLKGECNPSGSWLRPQSTVAVLIVSDEDNCSDALGCGTDAWSSGRYLTDYLHTIRQPGTNARVYGLIGHPSLSSAQCSTMASKANTYAAVIDDTGGSWGSICDADYSTTLQTISRDISVILLTQFPLKQNPTVGSLKVYRDNVLLNSGYALHGNIVEFEAPPAAGSTIRVDYSFNAAPPQNEFVLREKAEASALSVSIDGIEEKNYRFDSAVNSIVFESAPKASSIKAVYRRADPLVSEFQLEAGLELANLSVKVNQLALAAADYSYRKSDGMLVLKSAPKDKASLAVSYEKILEPRLQYPLLLAPDSTFSAVDTGSGVTINSNRQDNRLNFAAQDFHPGRKISILTKEREAWTVSLSSRVLAASLQVASSGQLCRSYHYFGNTLDLSRCGFSSGANVQVGFQYEAEHQEIFELALAGEVPATARWRVWVNGDLLKATEYTLENGHIKIADLPVNAKVEVEMKAL